MSSLPTTCVIGAGSSGITAVKALAGHGFDVTAYDKSDRVGGNWVWGNNNGMSSAYRSLHINTFRDRIRFGMGVEHAERRPDGVWEITLDDGNTHRYDALLVANGHHWNARWPEPAFPGSEVFEG